MVDVVSGSTMVPISRTRPAPVTSTRDEKLDAAELAEVAAEDALVAAEVADVKAEDAEVAAEVAEVEALVAEVAAAVALAAADVVDPKTVSM